MPVSVPCWPDRIRLPLEFDAGDLAADVDALGLDDFIYYDVMPLRAPAHLVDPARPKPDHSEDYADGSWADWLDTAALDRSPNLGALVETFRAHCRVTLVRLLRLEAGAEVREHNDPALGLEQANSVIRLTVPIRADDAVEFYLNDSIVPMRPGECWYLRLSDPHRIVNASDAERVNLSLDLLPNDWLLQQLSAGLEGADSRS